MFPFPIPAFFSSRLFKILLFAVFVAGCIFAFNWWISSIEKAGYDKGRAEARAEYQEEKDKYFGGLAAAAAAFNKGTEAAANAVKEKDKASALSIKTTVNNALEEWKKNPLIVYDKEKGDCTFNGPEFTKRWNEVNQKANAEAAK